MDFQKLDQDGLSILEEWFKDPEVLNWLSGTLPLLQWYNYVDKSSDYFAWMVLENGFPTNPQLPGKCALLSRPFKRHRSGGY